MELKCGMLSCMTQLTTTLEPTTFDRTTSLAQIALAPIDGDHAGAAVFTAMLDEAWTSLVGIHGGYMCALAVRGAELLVPGRPVRTVTTSFLRTGAAGPARLTMRLVRSGRSLATVDAELSQAGKIVTTSRLTLMDQRPGVEWHAPALADMAPIEDCVPLDPPTRVVHLDQAEAVLDPSSIPFTNGARAMVRGYFRPLENRPVDSAWLAMACDWFPPPAFVRVDPPVGGVSIDLMTHVHQSHLVLGPDEWLKAAFEIEHSIGGLAVEHGRIVAPDGSLVAESFQTRLTAQG